jgi:hypothetical protein
MRRHCHWCGASHDWHAMPLIDAGTEPRFANFGYELRNDPHGSTLAEPIGLTLAARHVAPAVPKQVRLMTTEV